MKAIRATLLAALVIGVPAFADESAGPLYVPYKRFGIYALGETAGWHVTLPWGSHAATYVIRENNLTEIGRGRILPGKPTNIEARLDRPGMVYVEVTEEAPGAKPKALGAAVAPEKIQPSIPAPADFDAFLFVPQPAKIPATKSTKPWHALMPPSCCALDDVC